MKEDNSISDPSGPKMAFLKSQNSAEVRTSATFEWPDDNDSVPQKVFVKEPLEQYQGDHPYHWFAFWVVTWGGTTLAGGLFGGLLGMVGILNDPTAPLLGFLFGAMWAGATGLFVFLHIGVICWTFWWLSRPNLVATIAGLLVGAICGLVVFSLVTGPMGAAGAYLAGRQFLKSRTGKFFEATIKSKNGESAGRLRFTTTDLFLRMTAISVMIAGWTAWIKAM